MGSAFGSKENLNKMSKYRAANFIHCHMYDATHARSVDVFHICTVVKMQALCISFLSTLSIYILKYLGLSLYTILFSFDIMMMMMIM
jgi:hypothetical protein